MPPDLPQRGTKRHSGAVSAQAYAGAAVARTATGQFAPAMLSKRRRTDGGVQGDAEYPGLPASGMTRPSIKVGGLLGRGRRMRAVGEGLGCIASLRPCSCTAAPRYLP